MQSLVVNSCSIRLNNFKNTTTATVTHQSNSGPNNSVVTVYSNNVLQANNNINKNLASNLLKTLLTEYRNNNNGNANGNVVNHENKKSNSTSLSVATSKTIPVSSKGALSSKGLGNLKINKMKCCIILPFFGLIKLLGL